MVVPCVCLFVCLFVYLFIYLIYIYLYIVVFFFLKFLNFISMKSSISSEAARVGFIQLLVLSVKCILLGNLCHQTNNRGVEGRVNVKVTICLIIIKIISHLLTLQQLCWTSYFLFFFF